MIREDEEIELLRHKYAKKLADECRMALQSRALYLLAEQLWNLTQ